MRCFAQVCHPQWIEAPISVVRAQFADLDHHINANVHPHQRLALMSRNGRNVCFVRELRRMGLRQRDVFERHIALDGSIVDRSVEGSNKGGSRTFHFEPETVAKQRGTRVEVTVRLPLPRVIGRLLKPLYEAQLRRELVAAAQRDRDDIVERGYPRPRFIHTHVDVRV